jgi:hypothetical protein
MTVVIPVVSFMRVNVTHELIVLSKKLVSSFVVKVNS